MKCPKCDYLGFETGDRCRNCGYDFSLIAVATPETDLTLRTEMPEGPPPSWLDAIDGGLGDATGRSTARRVMTPDSPQPSNPARTLVADTDPFTTHPPPSFRGAPSLPLFSPNSEHDDQPLVKLPAAPRAPLSVRRTPDTPRLRAAARPARVVQAPTLEFADASEEAIEPSLPEKADTMRSAAAASCGPAARLMAALADHAILLAVDVIVIYFTLRVAALQPDDWRALPPIPLVIFLALLKLAYFAAFTSMGGQTIGKMALGIRVVSEDAAVLDSPRALRRTCAGALSFLTGGLGFLVGLVDTQGRTLHDRLAHTRVIAHRSV